MSKAVKSDFSPVVQKRKFFENDKSPVGGSEELEVAQNNDTQDIVQDQRGAELMSTRPSFKLTLPNRKRVKCNRNMSTNQGQGQDSCPVGCQPKIEDLKINPSLKEPFFNRSSDVGRRWHSLHRICYHTPRSQNFRFRVISYNVLADGLLHAHSELYSGVEQWMKDWEYRRRNLLQEILHYEADVICLQEVEKCHFEAWFEPRLKEKGYTGIYMKRTRDKTDGCATFFKHSRFTLVKSKLVSFLKPDVRLMDRDNVAIVVLLKPKCRTGKPPPQKSNNLICVSNTHVLFNKKRGDIKLAQLTCLFAEINEMARITSPDCGDCKHHPIICCGDFNSTPYSPIYNFVARGVLNYQRMFRENLSGQCYYRACEPIISNMIPWELGIDAFCCKRDDSLFDMSEDFGSASFNEQQQKLQPSSSEENSVRLSDPHTQQRVSVCQSSECSDVENDVANKYQTSSRSVQCHPQQSNEDQASQCFASSSKEYSFAGEQLNSENKCLDSEEISDKAERNCHDSCTSQKHGFNFYSVYWHHLQNGCPTVTTFHDSGSTTVDYMFASRGIRKSCYKCKSQHGCLELEGNLNLLSEGDIRQLGGLPNKFISSDHLSLVASFLLHL